MAVIVAALLIVAMILPGLVVKAEAAEEKETGETGSVRTTFPVVRAWARKQHKS